MSQPLTARQEECLRLTRLMTDRQIAAHLGVSEATVKKHVLEACRRLGVNRRKAGLALLEQDDASAMAAQDHDADPVPTEAAINLDGEAPARFERRFGYRPPPQGYLKRVAMIGLATVVSALALSAVTDLVASYHYRVGVMDTPDRASLPDGIALSDDAT